ncbi:MAG TPA: hypothetical protein G4O11_11995 [Anaerolineae bacterium]|nr:hypothetical protein [Anaerolineae bacterium]
MRVTFTRVFLIATTVEGIAAFLLLFRIPSEETSAWLFGFSRVRFLTGVVTLLPVLFLTVISLRALLQKTYTERLIMKLEEILDKDNIAFHLLAFLSVILGFGLFFLLIINSPLGEGNDQLIAIYQRSASLLFWMLAVSAQSIPLLLIFYAEIYRQKIRIDPSILLREGVYIAFMFFAFLHWSILFFNIDWFHRMYGWYFGFLKHQESRPVLFLSLMLITSLVVWITLKYPSRWWRNLLLLICLGYGLQIGFGFIEGEGWESLRTRYVERGRSRYSEIVSKDTFDIRSIRDYESNYGNIYHFLSTKPHGYLVFYATTRGVFDLLQPDSSGEDRFENLTRFMAVLYPLIAMLVLPLLLRLARLVLAEEVTISPLILYVCFPGVILFTLQLDQVFFPFLFTAGILLGIRVSENRSWLLSLAMGIFLYLVVFVSFSLLPLLFFLGAYLFLSTLFSDQRWRMKWSEMVRMGGLWLAGFMIAHVIMRTFYNIDLLQRFPNAMEAHERAKGFVSNLPGIAPASLVNNSEFAIWIGFPMLILVLPQFLGTFRSLRKREIGSLDLIVLSFILTLIPLNVFGNTRAEVARLWLFTLPVFSLFISNQIKLLPFSHRMNHIIIVGTQLVSTYLIFLYQFPAQ